MITVGTTVVSGSPINGGGGAGLPVASGAGEVPISTGAGITYAAANFGDEVAAAIANAIGAVSGQAVIGDGAGDLATTSADVSALLAASDTAGMLSALSLSWSEIAATAFTHTPGAVTGGLANVVSSRLHTELAGVIADDLSGGFLGPRHEIALPVDDGIAWSVAARISFTGLDSNGRISLSLRRTTVQILGATIRDSGNLETFSDVASPTSTISAGFASGNWLRLTRRGGIMEVYTGTGASLAATVWTWRASIAVASGQLPLTLTVSMAQYSSAPSSPPLASDVGPVYITSGAGGGGGGGLPSGGTAGDVLLGDETWEPLGDAVTTGLTAILGAEPAGTVGVSDGAGGLATTSAAVSAVLAAASAAAARAALGFAPSTLAAQARLVAATRRGPVAMTGWSDSNYVAPIAAPSSGAQPSIVRGSSFVVSLYAPTAAPGAGAHLAVSADNALTTRGWLIAEGTAGANASNLVLYSASDAVAVQIPGVSTLAGWHAVAVSVSAGGVVRYSIDGGAAAEAVGTPALTARTTDDVRIGRGVGGGASGAATALAYLAVVGSVLSDADLATASATPGAGAPSLPSAPAWEWSAAGHLGCGRVSVGADVYQVVGTPALWMP